MSFFALLFIFAYKHQNGKTWEGGGLLNIGLKFLKKVWGTKTPPSLSQAENVCP